MKNKFNRWFSNFGGAAILLTMGGALAAEQFEDFGYGRMKMGGVEARGPRPLVVVLQQFEGAPAVGIKVPGAAPPLAMGVQDTGELMFNYFKFSANGYFLENSKGRFYWTRAGAGVYGPFIHNGNEYDLENPNDNKSLKRLNLALQDLVSAGFNFDSYDTNRDGVVQSNELTVMVIDNISDKSGGNRPPSPICYDPPNQNVKVCLGGMISVGHNSSFATFVHELSHQLGTSEMYGSDYNANSHYTLMAGTEFPNNGDRRTFHLDPWHKMMLGWVEPQVYSMDQPGTATIGAAQLVDGAPPVILYSPSRGPLEFFMLEFRSATLPGGAGYDANVNAAGVNPDANGTGLVVWHIKTNGAGGEKVNDDVSAVPFNDGPGVLMISAFMNGAPNFSWGKGGVWAPNALIPYQLKWLESYAGNARIKVGALSGDKKSLTVSWGDFPDPPPPPPGQKLVFYNPSALRAVTGVINDASATVTTLEECDATKTFAWSHVIAGGGDLFFYQDSSGAAAIGSMDGAGNCTLSRVFLPGTFGRGWTHIVYHKGFYFFYNKSNGTGAAGRFENRTFRQYGSWTGFSPNWTNIVSTPNGLLFYNASSGNGEVGEWTIVYDNTKALATIDSVRFTQLQSYESFSTGWTHIVNTNDGVLYYNANTGAHVMGEVKPGGVLTTRSDSFQTLQTGWTSIVCDGTNILFYNAANGTAAVGFIHGRASILTAGNAPPAGSLGIRRNLSGFSQGWTSIVAVINPVF